MFVCLYLFQVENRNQPGACTTKVIEFRLVLSLNDLYHFMSHLILQYIL